VCRMYDLIAPLSGDPGVGNAIASLFGSRVVKVHTKDHPDGELYLRLGESVKGEDILIVQSMYPSQDRKFIETLLAIDAAKRSGASEIDVLITYLAYARQDKVFLEGEPVSVNTILRSMIHAGADRIYVVEPHSDIPLKTFRENLVAIDGVTPLARRFAGEKDLVVFSPDIGGIDRAARLSRALGVEFHYIDKKRDRFTGEVSSTFREDLDLSGRTTVIVDDIISTGGTIAKAIELLIKRGSSKVYVACVHGIFVKGSVERILGAGAHRIVCGKTTSHIVDHVEYIDLHEHIAEEISRAKR